MVEFKEFVIRFNKLEPYVRKESTKILADNGKEIVEMMKEQHHDGLNSEGKQMQNGYSKGYAGRRKKKGLQTKYVDLHFSGDYHDKLKTVVVKDGVDVVSNVDYEKYLRGNFPAMAGLKPENAKEMTMILADILAPKIKQYLIR